MTIGLEWAEPAASNHTPPGWPIEIIDLKPSGKAPKRYGPDAFRFSAALTLSVILPRRGWTLIKTTKTYAYLRPPSDQMNQPFRISIAVPTPAECLALAQRSFAKGESWIGQIGEWPAWYFHERNQDMRRLWRNPTTGEMESELNPSPPVSSLHIGEWGAWEATVTGTGGNFALGVLPPSIKASMDAGVPHALLFEGGVRSAELTQYERNPEARRLCIAHYGAVCQACDLAFEQKYGAIGADLIHVHHVTPLSMIGEVYQVDPIRDLVPLCANCHHVAHQRNPPYTIAEIRNAIARQAVHQSGATRDAVEHRASLPNP
ncbi:HNH endonuclease [Sphingobium limneticum]|uniref:HNH endonuclease n=1 Tax=Sphingobium limneticum TaxID=1007511 RepID=UPI003D0840A9